MQKDDKKMLTATEEQINGIVIGVITAFNPSGDVLVAFGNNPNQLPISAKSTTPITTDDIGRQAALMFENGDVRFPIVMGLIQNPIPTSRQKTETGTGTGIGTEKKSRDKLVETEGSQASSTPALTGHKKSDENFGDLVVDGQKMTLNAKEQITLKCGKASITMTSAGKIIVRGAYISNKSSGLNRIHGGSVQIN